MFNIFTLTFIITFTESVSFGLFSESSPESMIMQENDNQNLFYIRSDLWYLCIASMRKCLCHYLLQHFHSILSCHLSSLWLLVLLGLQLLRLISSVYDHLTTKVLCIGHEILRSKVHLNSFELIHNVSFSDKVLLHKTVPQNIFTHKRVKVLNILLDFII